MKKEESQKRRWFVLCCTENTKPETTVCNCDFSDFLYGKVPKHWTLCSEYPGRTHPKKGLLNTTVERLQRKQNLCAKEAYPSCGCSN
jgi:hypothetical protein